MIQSFGDNATYTCSHMKSLSPIPDRLRVSLTHQSSSGKNSPLQPLSFYRTYANFAGCLQCLAVYIAWQPHNLMWFPVSSSSHSLSVSPSGCAYPSMSCSRALWTIHQLPLAAVGVCCLAFLASLCHGFPWRFLSSRSTYTTKACWETREGPGFVDVTIERVAVNTHLHTRSSIVHSDTCGHRWALEKFHSIR